MRRARILVFLLALAMVVTALVPATVQAAGKVVTVGTQAELEEALKDPEVTKIAIKAKKGKTLTIPEGDYSDIALVVEAAKVKLNNHGTFRVVKVRDAKEYNEHATGNTVKITAPKITVAVSENAEVKALHLAKKDAEHTVEIKGEVKKVTVAESAKVDLTVDGTLEALNVKKASDVTVAGTTEKTIVVNTSTDSHGTTLETAVTVDVRTKDFIDITLTEGSEGSDVVVKNDAGDVKLHNQTEATVLVEEKDGTQHEAAHTETVDTRDQAEIEADEAVTPDAGETEDTTGDDTTTEDDETEDTTGDETTGDDTTIEDTTGDTATEDTTGDTTTGGSTGSTSTVTPPVVIPTFTVTFDVDGGSSVDSQTVYYGQEISMPTSPTKTGYRFASWYIDEMLVTWPYTVTSNVTMKANWSKECTVSYVNTDGTPIYGSETITEGMTASKPGNDPTKIGYEFLGWYAVGAVNTYDFTTPVTDNLVLTAKWKDITKPVITVSAETVYVDVTALSTWTPDAVVASDNHDGQITATASLDIASLKAGLAVTGSSITVEYTAVDAAGNQAELVKVTYVSYDAIVTTSEELIAALENKEYIVLGGNIDADPEIVAPYGNYTTYVQNGGTIDGNGYTLSNETYGDDYGIMTYGGTIKNVTISGPFRGVVTMNAVEDVILENVVIKDCGYGINTGELSDVAGINLKVTNCTIGGWSSWQGGFSAAEFTNTHFVVGDYFGSWPYDSVAKPYVATTFKNCDFAKDYYLDLSARENDCVITLDGCTVNGEVLTAENIHEYLTIELTDGTTVEKDTIIPDYLVIK